MTEHQDDSKATIPGRDKRRVPRQTAHQQLLALWEALDGGPKPRCRDCADHAGRCPGDNLPCDPQERALEQIATLRTCPVAKSVLRKALRPFARAARYAEDDEPDSTTLFSSSARHEIKLGHLRAARRALSKAKVIGESKGAG